ncbi:MAG: hypothetical protein IKD45_02080 [Clostridia bacterium]|nr:hypothetical protein [Clostridia bacterium]
MYRLLDEVNGLPPRLYRSPEEIRRDIADIKRKIGEVNELFNIRELISSVISESEGGDMERMAAAASELADSAEEALSELRMLSEMLTLLRAELSAALGIIK